MNERTNEKTRLEEDLRKCEEEMMEICMQASEHQAIFKNISRENNLLNKNLEKIIKHDVKSKIEGSRMQFELEKNL